MEYPVVKVTDISNIIEELPEARRIDLGDERINDKINGLLKQIRSGCKKAYVLRWEGNKIPRGAVVGNEPIGWTQNGQAISKSGNLVGIYDRVEEFGGKSGRGQVMIVYTF